MLIVKIGEGAKSFIAFSLLWDLKIREKEARDEGRAVQGREGG